MSRLNVTAVVRPIARTDTLKFDDFMVFVSVTAESGEWTKALQRHNFKIHQLSGPDRDVVTLTAKDGFYVLTLNPEQLAPGHYAFGVTVEAGSKKNPKRVETGLAANIPTDFGRTIAAGYLPT